jgi:general secretion pathway protein G
MIKGESKKQKGFTLIELLVVISIISLLSSIILASIQDARKKAQYVKFDTEFLALRTAVELYRSDHGGDYPDKIKGTYLFLLKDIILELNSEGYFSGDSINLPNGYYINESAYSTTEVTCGSTVQSGGNYSLLFNTDSIGSNTSRLPRLFYNGVSQDIEGSSYWYCIEV